MNLHSILIPPFLVATLACAQDQSTAISKTQSIAPYRGITTSSQFIEGGAVVGHVYREDVHAPARLARVNLVAVTQQPGRPSNQHGAGPTSVTTDMDGTFEMYGVPPGSYYVDASLPGYVSPMRTIPAKDIRDTDPDVQLRVRQKIQIITVNAGDTVRINVSLEHGATISGIVHYDDGAPVTNALIEVSALTVDPKAAVTLPGTQTDDRGTFRITGLPEGTYILSSMENIPLPGRTQQGIDNTMHAPRTQTLRIYAPSTFHRAAATPIKLTTGESRDGIEIILPINGLHTVSGTVSNASISQSITLIDKTDSTFIRRGSINPDGTFEIHQVPDGQYTLQTGNSVRMGVMVSGGDLRDVTVNMVTAQQ